MDGEQQIQCDHSVFRLLLFLTYSSLMKSVTCCVVLPL